MNPQTEQAASERFAADLARALALACSAPKTYEKARPNPLSEHLGRCSSCGMLATLVNGECWACGEGGGK